MPHQKMERKVSQKVFMKMLRRFRLSKGMTLEKLASRLNVNANTVQAWEVGRNMPRPSMYPKIARVLEIDPLELTKIIDPDIEPFAPVGGGNGHPALAG